MVTDSTDLSATASVSVVSTLDELEINPKVATLSPGASITFVATGGVEPYDFSFGIDPPPSGGTITSGGLYTAGPITGVSDTIVVTGADATVCAIPASVSVVGASSNVNYSVTADTFPSGVDAGSEISDTFTVTNTGTGNGSKPVSWWLYLSEDGEFGGNGETLIDSNSNGFLNAGDSATVDPPGNWPNIGGTFTLFIMVSAEDDMTHSDNIYEKIDSQITLTVPDVDYQVSSVTNLDGTPKTAEAVDGWFRLENNGADPSNQAAQWEIWVSADDSIGVGDTRLYAGTATAPLAGEGTETEDIYFNTTGFWPASPGFYHLIARVISAEDTAAGKDGNNDTSLGPIEVTVHTVDYFLTAVEHHGSTEKVPGNTFDAQFSYENDPAADDGISTVSWVAYVSSDPSLGPEDILVAAGSGPKRDAGLSSGMITFSGKWPLHYGSYHIVVAISTTDNETDLGDNVMASAPVSIGYYSESAPNNDNWTNLPGPSPGTDYDILTGVDPDPTKPIALQPGMTLFIQGTNISDTDRDDVFMFNTGTASKITFTVTWDSGGDDLDLYLVGTPGGSWMVEVKHNGFANTLSLSTTKGSLPEQFEADEDLWFDLFCNINSPPLPYADLGPYEVVISVE
jgi:hypothetical protein